MLLLYFKTKMKKRIIIFASGNGSNVENIDQYFQHYPEISLLGVFTNNPNAGVINKAERLGLPIEVFDKNAFTNGYLLQQVKSLNPDLIILAGFLWKVGADWVRVFPNKIINIHPALLPQYGGKGMYGQYVHRAVKENKEEVTGITIHFVNEAYDEGAIIFQEKVKLQAEDQVEDIAARVHQLEYEFFPKIIHSLLQKESK